MPEYHSTWTAVQGIGRIHVHSEAQLVYLNIHFCCDSESVLQICHFISDSKKKVSYNVTHFAGVTAVHKTEEATKALPKRKHSPSV